jgi:hypothetical protein
MKNLFSFKFVLFCTLLAVSNYQCTKSTDRSVGVDLTTVASIVSSNVTKAGSTFEQTYTFKTGAEFQKRFGVPVSDITTFSVESFSVVFSDQRCNDLESYTVEAQFSQITSISKSNTCTFPDFNGKPTVIGFKRFDARDTRAIKVLDTNFASYLKAGKDIIITFKMVAAKDLPAGFGLKAELQAKIEYAVSE